LSQATTGKKEETLQEQEITRDQSSNWQRIASINRYKNWEG